MWSLPNEEMHNNLVFSIIFWIMQSAQLYMYKRKDSIVICIRCNTWLQSSIHWSLWQKSYFPSFNRISVKWNFKSFKLVGRLLILSCSRESENFQCLIAEFSLKIQVSLSSFSPKHLYCTNSLERRRCSICSRFFIPFLTDMTQSDNHLI